MTIWAMWKLRTLELKRTPEVTYPSSHQMPTSHTSQPLPNFAPVSPGSRELLKDKDSSLFILVSPSSIEPLTREFQEDHSLCPQPRNYVAQSQWVTCLKRLQQIQLQMYSSWLLLLNFLICIVSLRVILNSSPTCPACPSVVSKIHTLQHPIFFQESPLWVSHYASVTGQMPSKALGFSSALWSLL